MFRVLSATQDAGLTDRLVEALDGVASVVLTEPSLHALRDAIANVRPDLIVVDVDDSQRAVNEACIAIHALLEADPMHPIVAIGNDTAAATVLQVMRAGARDFIGRDSANDTTRRQIVAQLNRLTRESRPASGKLVVITSGQPNDGESLFAINYAVLRAQQAENVLLIDFHLPATLAGAALDIELNYTVRDAVNDLSRLDRTLLSSALGKHRESGLYVLPLAAVSDNMIDLTGASILSLMTTLRTMFCEIVVNFGGLRHSGLATELLSVASQSFLVSSQHFTSVKACRELLARLAPDAPARSRMVLAVTHYLNEIHLTDAQIASTLGIGRSVRIPDARAALANSLNKGVPLVIDQPHSAFAKALHALSDDQPRHAPAVELKVPRATGGLLHRLVSSVL